MKLLVVESPAKAKTIGKYLGKGFKVISSYGHIRGLPSKQGAVNPDFDFALEYQVDPKSTKHISEIVRSVKQSDEIYLATDPDREGEAISWHILEVLKEKKVAKNLPIKRVVFNEITKKAIQAAIKNSRDLDMNLVHAQQARQALDYLVGFTLSPVLWRKLPGSRSAGRVQSVALRMVCDREAEIEKFKQREYWTIEGKFKTDKNDEFLSNLTYWNGEKLEKFSITSKKESDAILKAMPEGRYCVKEIKKKQIKRNPNAPFTTSTMLQEASRKFGFSAKRTAQIAQKLYEGIDIGGEAVGLITYMRTDSVNVSEEAIGATKKLIQGSYGDKYLPAKQRIYKTKAKNAQEAHEAIRPTDVNRTPEKMRGILEESFYKLYSLIWKRMVASQMENAVFDSVAADIASKDGKTVFRANGSSMVFDGFYKVYREGVDDNDEKEAGMLPELNKGDFLDLTSAEGHQHFTQPPPRYTEATLVKKMEELGIGRPSTYPSIISILQDREYVLMDKKRFIPEARGRIVSAFLANFFAKYVEYGFTADLENELDYISDGKQDWKKVLKEFWYPFKSKTDETLEFKNTDVIAEVEKSLLQSIFRNSEGEYDEKLRKCPKCEDGQFGIKMGKFGSFIGCSNYPECNATRPLVFGNADEVEIIDNKAEDSEFPKELGEKEGEKVTLRKGPYGLYVQLGEKGKSVKRAGLPKDADIDNLTIEYALKLLSLPRVVGVHPETNEEIKVGCGRFGPFIQYQGKYISIKGQDPVAIELEAALEVIDANKDKLKEGKAKKAPAKKALKGTRKTTRKVKK